MKVCIYGAGAIGGFLGAGLADAGAAVSLVARGPHLAAIQANGLTLIKDGKTTTAAVRATDDPATLGVQDYVIVTLKAHSVIPALRQIAAVIGPDTAVVWAVNGIPWWYFHDLEGPWRDARLRSLDPGDAQWRARSGGRGASRAHQPQPHVCGRSPHTHDAEAQGVRDRRARHDPGPPRRLDPPLCVSCARRWHA